MTWRVIAAIQKEALPLNYGAELSGQLVLSSPEKQRLVTELSGIFSLYILESTHGAYKDLF